MNHTLCVREYLGYSLGTGVLSKRYLATWVADFTLYEKK